MGSGARDPVGAAVGRAGFSPGCAGHGYALCSGSRAVAPVFALRPFGDIRRRHCGHRDRRHRLRAAAMGSSWRIGVDASENAPGRARRVFGRCATRSTSMFVFWLGGTLIAPNIVAIVGYVLLTVSIELQVRFVEEPYLLKVHGESYREYAGTVGRFVPRTGLVHMRSVRRTRLTCLWRSHDHRRPPVRRRVWRRHQARCVGRGQRAGTCSDEGRGRQSVGVRHIRGA